MLNKKTNSKKLLISSVLILCLLVIVGGFFGYRQTHKSKVNSEASKATTSNIDLSSATPADKQYSDNQKQDSVKQQNQTDNTPTPNSTSSKKIVNPTIVDASQYGASVEVRSYIDGIIEDGGTSTITFSNDTKKIEKTVKASANATNTTTAQ